jgi:hypothetical protein
MCRVSLRGEEIDDADTIEGAGDRAQPAAGPIPLLMRSPDGLVNRHTTLLHPGA